MNLIFVIILLGNIWILKIFNNDALTGVFILLSSIFIYLFIKNPKNIYLLSAVILLLLSIYKIPNILKINLGYNDQESIVMNTRLNEYPPITFLPVAHWLEERPETIAIYKITDNFAQLMDPNLYFFANHPRERTGISEIEKFPYILLPFFIYGIFRLFEDKKYKVLLFLAIPLIFYSIYGFRSSVDPYLMFPFMTLAIYGGVSETYRKLNLKQKKIFPAIFLIIYCLVLFQNIVYAIY